MKCPLCANDGWKSFFNEKKADRVLRVVKCKKCGFVYTYDRVATQDQSSEKVQKQATKSRTGSYHKELKHILRIARKYFNGNPSLLDIGCSRGMFLDMAKESGFDVTGIELETTAAKYSLLKGHKVLVGNFLDLEIPRHSADIISMIHVLEHLENLRYALKNANSILKPYGKIIVEVPNLWHWMIQRMLLLSRGLASERHLYHFTPITLSRLLGSSGFRILRQMPGNRYDKKGILSKWFQFIIMVFSSCIFEFTGKVVSNSIRIIAEKKISA